MAWRSGLCRRITHTARPSLLRSVDLWAVRYARACTDARSRPLQKAPLPAHFANRRCQLRRRNLPGAQPSLALHLTSPHKREKQRHAKREYPCRLAKRVVPPHTRIARTPLLSCSCASVVTLSTALALTETPHHKSRCNPYTYEYAHPLTPVPVRNCRNAGFSFPYNTSLSFRSGRRAVLSRSAVCCVLVRRARKRQSARWALL